MRSALVGQKPDFVKLLLENGVCLREFLTEETLVDLYSNLKPGCIILRRLDERMEEGCKSSMCLRYVSDEVQEHLGGFTEPIYPLGPDAAQPFIEMPEDNMVSVSRSEKAC